jgi:hypothetical protein
MSTTGEETSFSTQQAELANSIFTAPFGKEALAWKAKLFTEPEFVQTRILPLMHLTPNGHGPDYSTTIVQNTGTGRLTLRYDFGSENIVYAKLYIDDLGSRCHEVNCALWDAGFNANGRYRVPQPVGFLADHNVLLMRCVPGAPLGAAFDGNASVDLAAGSREAAKWLALLHRSSLKTGTPDSDWDSLKLFRMAGRLIKAAAACPEKLDMVRELMDKIERRITSLPVRREFLFTHGRYHHDHVFLGANVTAVIDLDRCRPSDPAKDAAEFVRVLRLTAFKEGFDMNRADEATTAFLNTYLAEVPEAAASLGCYWAAYVFHSLLGCLKKRRAKGNRSWEELIDFYVSEIRRALDYPR